MAGCRRRMGSPFVAAALFFLALLQLISLASSFCTPQIHHGLSFRRRLCHLQGSSGAINDDGDWQLYNDFEQFLNQCALQALLFHMNSLKDRNTAHWLEDFIQPVIHKRTKETTRPDHETLSNMASAWNGAMHDSYQMEERKIQLLTYHGLAAMNTTIFPTWDAFFGKLLEEPTVSYEIESNRPNAPTYTLDIVPASLCSRIISVREQIAREFVNDLDVIADNSLTAMEKYKNNDNKLEPIHPYFLEISVHEDYKPSPLRKGNFDLLQSLTTQEAVHRILNRDMEQKSVQFLRNFYLQRIPTHFTGSSFYGRADDFLDELLQTMPSMVQLQDTETGMVDPVSLVELIFEEREKVASDWLELSLDVPQSHQVIKRLQLDMLMGSYGKSNTVNEDSSFQ